MDECKALPWAFSHSSAMARVSSIAACGTASCRRSTARTQGRPDIARLFSAT